MSNRNKTVQLEKKVVYGKDGRKMSPNSINAIKQHEWKAGQSGNPSGRPKEPNKYFKEEIKRILKETVNAKDRRSKLEALTASVVDTILNTRNEGLQVRGFEMLKDSIDGKPLQETAISTQAGALTAGILLIPTVTEPELSPEKEIKPLKLTDSGDKADQKPGNDTNSTDDDASA